MRTPHPDPRPTRPRARTLPPGWLTTACALASLLLASCGDDPGNPCLHPPLEIGSLVTTVEAADDPCAGQSKDRIVAWFEQGSVRYPLRCGVRDDSRGRGGYGYVHIRYDSTPQDTTGHGDAVNDSAFAAEITNTLAHGQEGHVGGGSWRYTLEYPALKASCTKSWGFRVVLAKQPSLPDGYPTGIITALQYTATPVVNP